MNKIALKIGNTTIALATSNQPLTIKTYDLKQLVILDLMQDIKMLMNDDSIINICSTNNEILKQISISLEKNKIIYHIFDYSIEAKLDYSLYQKESLGLDRIIACNYLLQKSKSFILVDCGSATTINVVIDNVFKGGLIIPSIPLSFEHLKLKFTQFNNSNPTHLNGEALALNTNDSLNLGIVHAHYLVINHYLELISTTYPLIKIYMTGGNAPYILEYFKQKIIFDQNILIKALLK
ncbi:MAG: type III pantothenate kinase [Bacilli bacterium]